MAIEVNGNDIIIPRGDSVQLNITPYMQDEPYMLDHGESVMVTVETTNRSVTVIKKNSDVQDEKGAISFDISPKEMNLDRGSYYWSAKLIGNGGETIDTFIGGIKPASFIVK